jgi:hypothetical protein
VSAQLILFPPFSLLGVASPSDDVVTPRHRITLPFHWAKMSSLPPLHLPGTLCPITSPLELKLKHWVRTTIAGYPPRTTRIPPSTAIKKIISTLIILPITQSRLYFTFSLDRAPHHRSSTRHHCSLSPLSYAYCPSAQRHLWWWTNRPSFACICFFKIK